ncbi:uroporphyrinogen-III synthase [Cryobacterium mesophilum]|nr:uroporphyrinogen-III synthase [Terrimesophilobacter mesophilus]
MPVIAPMTNFAATENSEELAHSFTRLSDGEFEWLVVTSSTTVDVLVGHAVRVPEHTKIAAVGESTTSALVLAGYRVDLAPAKDNSSRGLVKEWRSAPPKERVLVPQSEDSDDVLVTGLIELGIAVEFVTAYRTVGVAVPRDVADDVASGAIQGVLITSGSVARQIQTQLAPLPEETVVAAIGPRTAFDARAAGIRVDVIAESRTADALVAALIEGVVR